MHKTFVTLLVIALPLTAAAQRITITPTIGAFVPLRDQSPGGRGPTAALPVEASLRRYGRSLLRPRS